MADRATRRPLLTRDSILILSGLLAGVGFGGGLSGLLPGYTIGAAAVGIVSYLGMVSYAELERKKTIRREQIRKAKLLEGRLRRHVSHPLRATRHATPFTPNANVASEFMAVVKR